MDKEKNEENTSNDSADKLIPSNNPQEVQSVVNDNVDVSINGSVFISLLLFMVII